MSFPADLQKSPVVTVVIPVYNRPEKVQRAIRSILTQTLQDFEIVVVDDGSSDGTAAAVAAFKDSRVRLVRHDTNRGVSIARNTGIKAASAPYIAFLDSDDEALPSRLEKQLAVFEREANVPALVCVGHEVHHSDGQVIRYLPPAQEKLRLELLTTNVIGGTSVGMVRRDALDAIGGFDESLRYTEEHDLWLRLAELAPVGSVPEVLVRIIQREARARLSLDLDAVMHGRRAYRIKHDALLRHRGVLHLYLREDGWIQHRHGGWAGLARRSYWEAIKARPGAPLTYLMFLAACMPAALLNAAASARRHLRGLLRGPQAPPDSVTAHADAGSRSGSES